MKDLYPTAILNAVRGVFNRFWTDFNPGTALKEIKDRTEKWTTSSRASRREEVVLCRLRLGHTRFTHSYIIDREPRPQCDDCQCPQSVKHILIECPIFTNQRRSLNMICQERGIRLCLKSLLGDELPEVLDEVFKFLRSCELVKRL